MTSIFCPGRTVRLSPCAQIWSLRRSLNSIDSWPSVDNHNQVEQSQQSSGNPCSQLKPEPWPRTNNRFPNPTSILASIVVVGSREAGRFVRSGLAERLSGSGRDAAVSDSVPGWTRRSRFVIADAILTGIARFVRYVFSSDLFGFIRFQIQFQFWQAAQNATPIRFGGYG